MNEGGAGGGSGAPMALIVMLATAAALLLVAWDSAGIPAYLPWLLLAACPLVHYFMHRGHGHRHGEAGRPNGHSAAEAPPGERRSAEEEL